MNSIPSDDGQAFIFLNGDFQAPFKNWPQKPAANDIVIAADGGARHLRDLGWPLHCLVGDFDSIEPDLLADFQAKGTEIHRHPASKDEIDFELALMWARKRGYLRIDVLGALGGRWDMTFGNLFLPRAVSLANEAIRFLHGHWTFQVVCGPVEVEVEGNRGDRLSLIPLGEDVGGVSLENCLYPLEQETLSAGLSRGMSNELQSSRAKVNFDSGCLMIIHEANSEAG